MASSQKVRSSVILANAGIQSPLVFPDPGSKLAPDSIRDRHDTHREVMTVHGFVSV